MSHYILLRKTELTNSVLLGEGFLAIRQLGLYASDLFAGDRSLITDY